MARRRGAKSSCGRRPTALCRRLYGELRKPGTVANPDAGWDSVATKQPDANLAARAGEIEPIGRYSGAESSKVEDIAFALKVGEVSPIVDLSIGFMVIKRIGTIEPEKKWTSKSKPELYKEVIDRKLVKEVPKLSFDELKKQANPVFIGKPALPQPDPALLPPGTK